LVLHDEADELMTKQSSSLPPGQGHVLLTAIFFEEDGGITGFVEEFLGVSAHGRNLKEARTLLVAAAEKHMHEHREGVRQWLASYGSVTRERLVVEITRE
jgi:predicted RNase H-like HicB family nuclease